MWGKDGYTGSTLPYPLHLVEKVTPPLGKSLAQPQYITIIVKNSGLKNDASVKKTLFELNVN